MRGFTLNREGSQQLNFNIMKTNAQREGRHPLDDGEAVRLPVRESHKIVRRNKAYELYTQPRHKTYRLVANKRVFHHRDDTEEEEDDTDPFLTFPYGYSDVNPELLAALTTD